MKKIIVGFLVILFCFAAVIFLRTGTSQARENVNSNSAVIHKNNSFDQLIRKATESGSAHVIIGLQVLPSETANFSEETRKADIKRSQQDFLARYQSFASRNVKLFDYIPYLAIETDAAALSQMRGDDLVFSIEEDVIGEPALAESTQLVGAPSAWTSGYTGSGQTIAIIDSGVDKNHGFLSGKVISEACFSTTNATSTSVCPGGVSESTAADSGLHCPTTTNGCAHGTNVAGIAAGKGTSFSGVAKDANIIAIQIFSQFTGSATCGATSPCARYWTSDLIKGLERVRTLTNSMSNIVAVNLSLQTGQQFTSNCDSAHSATKAVIDNLRSVGVATVICSGNYAFTNALTAPACISTSISVGSVDDGSSGTTLDAVSNFSDSSPLLHLLAPGRWINSSIPGNVYQNYSGTSMAAPHIAGAFAVLKQRKPNASIDRVLNTLTATGQPITDTRNGLIKPRLRVDLAVTAIADDKNAFDYDGDGKADVSVFRPAAGSWYISNSSNNSFSGIGFGAAADLLAPADFDGDGKTDISVFRGGNWYRLNSSNNSFAAVSFGQTGDLPVPADFDGDGKADISVYRTSTGNWYRLNSSDNSFTGIAFGTVEDKPQLGDFDGDGKADICVFRPSTGGWYRLNSSNGQFVSVSFGIASDLSVPSDYDGDGRTDIGVYRNGNWYRLNSSDNSFSGVAFGNTNDKPVPADYDGDGKADIGVFRPADGSWYLLRSTAGFTAQSFGTNGDTPTPNAFVR